MSRKTLPRLLGAAATVVVLVVALTAIAGTGLAQTSAAQANYAPTNSAAPTISGTAAVGSTLTASNGTWNSDTTPTYAYQWQRCDSAGNNCASIAGASASTYTVQSADANSTLRVVVTATNSSGSASATSSQTAVVGQPGPAGAIKTASGETSIPASSVTLPEILQVNSVKFTPNVLRSRNAFTMRVHVVDTRGYLIRGALVQVTALPYAWAKTHGEATTDENGWANVTVTPTRSMPLARNALVLFVRARVEGQNLLGGSSTRRLVQVGIR
ncbi:MAG: hypothetical protein ABUS54_03675 [Actinomycetota bacterium]